jgi:hypothetical protein
MGGDLVEPEGVNAGSDEALRDASPAGDPVPGGNPADGPDQEAPPPAGRLTGPPPDPAESTGEVYGSQPPA